MHKCPLVNANFANLEFDSHRLKKKMLSIVSSFLWLYVLYSSQIILQKYFVFFLQLYKIEYYCLYSFIFTLLGSKLWQVLNKLY